MRVWIDWFSFNMPYFFMAFATGFFSYWAGRKRGYENGKIAGSRRVWQQVRLEKMNAPKN